MALPKLNDMPKYSVTIPSLKREVRIRPFVVKEEKILLVAMESQDPKQIAHAIIDTIESCVQDDIDTQKMTSYDVEYLFTQIRGKSVGETTNIGVNCPSCEHQNEVTVNLSEIKIRGEIPNHKINLTDNVIDFLFSNPRSNQFTGTLGLFHVKSEKIIKISGFRAFLRHIGIQIPRANQHQK